MAKMTTNENIPHQPVLTSNTSAMHMPASPHTPNMDTTSNPELLNVGQNQNEEAKNLLEPEVSFPKEEDNMDDSESSDDDIKINIQYDKENDQYHIRENCQSSDKSESAISLNIKRSKDRISPSPIFQEEHNNIDHEMPDSTENEGELIKIPIPSQEPPPTKEDNTFRISVPLNHNEILPNEDKEEEILDENKISINLGEDFPSPQPCSSQIQVHETDDPLKIKLTGKFAEMNFDDIDITKYLPKSLNKQAIDPTYASQSESSNLVQIDLENNNDEDDYVVKVPNVEDTPEKEEHKIQISVSDLLQSPDDGKISIPLLDPTIGEEEKQDSSVFRIPTDLSDKSKDTQKERKRDEKYRTKNESTIPNHRLRSDTFGEESKIEQVVIEDSVRKYYKLEIQKVLLKVALPDSQNSSEDSKIIQGQTIFMFNRQVEEDANKDAIRKLGLNFHSKYLKITKISTAKRFRKRDEKQKVIDTYHQRTGELDYNFDKEGFMQFSTKFAQNQSNLESENIEDNANAFEKKP